MFGFLFLAPYARTTRYEGAFFPWKTKEKKARFARAPHYYIKNEETRKNDLLIPVSYTHLRAHETLR